MNVKRINWVMAIALTAVSITALTVLAPSVYAQQSATTDPLLPIIVPGKGEACVEPVEDMRRNHMEYIMHQRDDTVLHGIRTSKHSLSGCVNCHAQTTQSGEAMPVNGKGEFCQSCHEYAAVSIDCFSCHTALPDSPVNSASRIPDRWDQWDLRDPWRQSSSTIADVSRRYQPVQ